MTYKITYRGMTIKEFDTVGEMDQYLADRIYEWVDLSPQHNAHLGTDYLELVNDRGTAVCLSFTPVSRSKSFVTDDSVTERGAVEDIFN